MNKPRAVFLDKASVHPGDLEFSYLTDVADWEWFDHVNISDYLHYLEGVEIIVCNKVVIDRTVIENSEHLKLICIAATGVNNVDLEVAHQHGITVCNVRAYATASVMQHVFTLILALRRRLFEYEKSATDGNWSRSEFFCHFGNPVNELDGKTLGIIGYGELGQAVAKTAKCFGMKVLIAKRDEADMRSGRVDMKTMLSSSDVVSLHCPLTKNNRNLIGAQELAYMKQDALLINTARGGLVDESALLSALKSGAIGGAALDVLAEEPPSLNHPLINYDADNFIITPHIAWASRESRQRLINEIAINIQAYLLGSPRNVV